MECNFHIGQKVVCIDDTERVRNNTNTFTYVGSLDGLRRGCIYTIRDIYYDEIDNEICVRLEEIYRGKCEAINFDEPGYVHSRFRPLKDIRLS